MSPRKANQAQLSTAQIVAAALELIDETGLEGHTMRALGRKLGVDASTIYYHLPSKTALYGLIVDEVMSGLDLSGDDPSRSVEDRLVTAAWQYRRALLVHPRALPLVGVRSMRSRAQLSGIEILIGMFFDAGLSPAEAMIGIDAVGQTVLGMTSVYAAQLTASEYTNDGEPFAELPSEQFPNITLLLTHGTYLGFDVEFEATIRALVSGLLANAAAGTLIPADAEPVAVDPDIIRNTRNH